MQVPFWGYGGFSGPPQIPWSDPPNKLADTPPCGGSPQTRTAGPATSPPRTRAARPIRSGRSPAGARRPTRRARRRLWTGWRRTRTGSCARWSPPTPPRPTGCASGSPACAKATSARRGCVPARNLVANITDPGRCGARRSAAFRGGGAAESPKLHLCHMSPSGFTPDLTGDDVWFFASPSEAAKPTPTCDLGDARPLVTHGYMGYFVESDLISETATLIP